MDIAIGMVCGAAIVIGLFYLAARPINENVTAKSFREWQSLHQ